jgi:hypothetical protein
MTVTTLQGPVSHYQQSTETTDLGTAQLLTFRVNNRPVTYKSRSGCSISNGDGVTVMGQNKAGTLQAWCLRNDTTGAIFKASYLPAFAVGGLFLPSGILLNSFGAPLIIL